MRSLPPDEVHVWQADLSAGAEVCARLESALPAAERERSARFVFSDDRRRFIVAHAALREVLGAYLQKGPEELVFIAGPRGKPSLAGAADAWLRFNLSHSGDAALIACAREREIGADIEWMRDNFDCAEIVTRFFSPAEREEWETLPVAQRREAFFHGWTRKEAYVKALGEGLGHPPDAYTVRIAPASPPALLADTLRPGTESAWSLQAVPAPPGYAASIAVAGTNFETISRQWRPPPEIVGKNHVHGADFGSKMPEIS